MHPVIKATDRSHLHHGSRAVPAYVVVQLAPTRASKRMRGGRVEHPALAHRKVRQLLTEHGAELRLILEKMSQSL